MSNFEEQHYDEKLRNESNNYKSKSIDIFSKEREDWKNTPSSKYIKLDTLEYYLMPTHQITINPANCPLNGVSEEYEDLLMNVLTLEGKQKYQQAKQTYLNCVYRDEIEEYCIVRVSSGAWVNDHDSPHCKSREVSALLETQENFTIIGMCGGELIQTSVCVFINVEQGWCLTYSGNVYKLGIKLKKKEFVSKYQKFNVRV